MRGRICLIAILSTLLLAACGSSTDEQRREVDHANALSYHFRYLDIDSAAYYADRALSLAGGYESGRDEALNNKAFVAYQQMYYDSAQHIIDQVLSQSRNQVELLCGDVMKMKIAQRVGEGKTFFDSRHNALRRIRRIREEESTLTPHMQERFLYAHSELHIVSSTYYFYLGQDSMAIAELEESQQLVEEASDTAQWLYYHYMVGAGGMLDGPADDVCLQEFDHLMRACMLGMKSGYKYFCGNTLQSLSIMVADNERRCVLERERASELGYLLSLQSPVDSTMSPALRLATEAFCLFQQYNDIFQMACAKRTLGELNFREGRYEEALSEFLEALDYVERQSGRSSRQLPQWMAGIREQLSLTYSALGDLQQATANRAQYLDLLASTSQNYELESRKEQLTQELSTARLWLYALTGLFALTLLLVAFVIRRMKHHAAGHDRQIQQIHDTEQFRHYQARFDETVHELQDHVDDAHETLEMSRMNCARYRGDNVERRAKVAMVYSIIPYLDRIIATVTRMRREKRYDDNKLNYVHQLTDEIMSINDVLTDWIQISQGQVKLHVTTFPLQDVLTIVDGGHSTFAKKGLSLRVEPTSARVKADKALTLFMVNTLADNARKFTPAGGEVTISAQEVDDYVEVSVSDTGIGLSQADVTTINDSKLYDSTQLGNGESEKGFGFGIMNCKGIIGKYRKTSDHFRVCDFGVESEAGNGSRFWFRLPRVMVLIFAFLCCFTHVKAAPAVVECDTLELLRTYNDSAMAALSRHDWQAYAHFNASYVRLHHIYTADASLPADCARMQQLHANNAVLYALLVLLSIIVLMLIYFVFIRPRLSAKRMHDMLLRYMTEHIAMAEANLQDANVRPVAVPMPESLQQYLSRHPAWLRIKDDLLAELEQGKQKVDALSEQRAQLEEQAQKTRFEEERLYVMNQILDNCLSTIKHETMYYPARTMQMVEMMQRGIDDSGCLDELYELLQYYKRVYVLLHEQAFRQLEQNNFHRQRMMLSDICHMVRDELVPQMKRPCPQKQIIVASPADDAVIGDRELLLTLLRTIITAHPQQKVVVTLETQSLDDVVCFSLHFEGGELPAGDLFASSTGQIPYLIAKQIIREHDAYSGMPGLRLEATPTEDGYIVRFTLKRAKPYSSTDNK